jgi:hypothetical protein
LFHGLSTLVISIGGHFSRHEGERAPLIGAERDGLWNMIFDEGEDVATSDNNGEAQDEEQYRDYGL